MFSTLIVAVVFLGQIGDEPKAEKPTHPPIDLMFKAKVSDRVLLGARESTASDTQIGTPLCFSTLEKVKEFLSQPDDQYESGISTMVECCMARAGTSALIKERHVIKIEREGKTSDWVIARVQILEGEFKGKLFFTPGANIFRFVGDAPAPPPAKVATKKRAGRRTVPIDAGSTSDAKLILTDLAVNAGPIPNYMKVDGRVRCASDEPLKGIYVTVSFEDRAGKLLRSVEALVTPDKLSNGETGSFQAFGETDDRYSKVKVNFKDFRNNIPWADRSGMNAHD